MTVQLSTGSIAHADAERIVAAHRGAKRLAPENTLRAFETALSNGAVALELDVHLTSDEKLVVIHDSHVDRTTDAGGAVRASSLEEIRALDAGSWYSSEFAGERIPTLDEVLTLTHGRARLNIELKCSYASRVAESVIEAACRHDATDRVVIMSFDLDSVLAAKDHLNSPAWRTAGADLVVLPIVTQPLPDPLAFVEATGMDGLNYPPQLWDRDLIERFRAKGKVVHGGLINDAAALQGFFELGGQMADSDDPALFRYERPES